ncbi:4-aminobutyrate aminotransferase [Corynebacterium atypicum]|uniref:(S)-3-amino-2-methylpropionate transaminase n=1 Tax=Corynebacterium atypicum TaxID=191610 RepID=A0ABM5QNR4_9CORY|nr:4-aminobutyrate--2-oxoglutarate transaminase [Corynebacterium atypicum]AIG64386.1 4-aminobutyrate aminotransferase [Corynebacterium atypicum]
MQDFTYPIEQTRRIDPDASPGPSSQELGRRLKKATPRAVTPNMECFINAASGGILRDTDGNRFIDLASGIAVTSVGASHPKVVAAVQDAVSRFTHTSFMISPYESYVAVAEKLNQITPGEHEKTTALFNSGAEAVENAIKIARAATGKKAVVAFDNAFHGRTNLTMALTAKAHPYKSGFGPFADEVYRMPTSYPLRDALTGKQAAERAIRGIDKHVGAENLAALIIEPIPGEGGFIVPAEGYLNELESWARENGVIFIADEIQSGLARTGRWFASDWFGITPDIITTAKGIAGGMPLSAVTGRAEIMDACAPGSLGGTYGGNPVACAAALAALSAMEEEGLAARALEIEEVIRQELAAIPEGIAEIRGHGAMMAIEIVDAAGAPDPARTSAIAAACKKAGVLVLTCGLDGNVVRLLPPLVINQATLKDGLGVLVQAFAQTRP